MRNVAWKYGNRKAFDLTCETIKIEHSKNSDNIKIYRFVNGDENTYINHDIDEVIKDFNSDGYFISAVESNENTRIYYLTDLTIFAD